MKLAKREVTPFQAVKLARASESEVQTLKTTVSQHKEDSNRAFSSAMLRSTIFFAYRIAVCSVRCVYLEKNSLLRSSACADESRFQSRPRSEKHRSMSYAVGILERTYSASQCIAAIERCCVVNIISGFLVSL